MSGATGGEDVGTTERFEKSPLKLHCIFCGDTMFVLDLGAYVCIGCDIQQKILVCFDQEDIQVDERVLPEEVHVMVEQSPIYINFMDEMLKKFKDI